MSSVAMADPSRRQRITVDEYHLMAQVGQLAPDARVELIEGEIVEMPPIGHRHAGEVDRMTRLLVQAVGERAIVRCQGPIRLDDFSEPQPDFALLAPREDFYTHRAASASDVLLLIEVSETTLRYDRNVKGPLYARHGVPEYWILDLDNERMTMHAAPADGRYQEVVTLERPGIVPVSALGGVAVNLTGLFR